MKKICLIYTTIICNGTIYRTYIKFFTQSIIIVNYNTQQMHLMLLQYKQQYVMLFYIIICNAENKQKYTMLLHEQQYAILNIYTTIK